MKPTHNSIRLNNALNNPLFNAYNSISKQLQHSLHPEIQLELYSFLTTGLVSDKLIPLFKETPFLTFNSHEFENKISQFEINLSLMSLRYPFVEQFGFVLLNEQLLQVASDFLQDKSVCEIGAGTGWLSYQLQQKGINIIAVDYKPGNDSDFGFKKTHTDIVIYDGVNYLNNHSHDVVILSWPDYDTSFASNILKSLKKGQTLIYIGELEGGCTGDDKFFNLLNKRTKINKEITNKLQKEALSWSQVRDSWFVFEVTK